MPIATPDIPLVTIKRRVAGSVLLAGFMASLFVSAFLLFSVQPVVFAYAAAATGRLAGGVEHLFASFRQLCFSATGTRIRRWAFAPAGPAGPARASARIGPRRVATFVGGGRAARRRLPNRMAARAASVFRRGAFCRHRRNGAAAAAWFSLTTHPQARDPYFLYVASNSGSLLALLSYPVLIETTLDLSGQAQLWSAGFAATAVAVLACGIAAQGYAAPGRLWRRRH